MSHLQNNLLNESGTLITSSKRFVCDLNSTICILKTGLLVPEMVGVRVGGKYCGHQQGDTESQTAKFFMSKKNYKVIDIRYLRI